MKSLKPTAYHITSLLHNQPPHTQPALHSHMNRLTLQESFLTIIDEVQALETNAKDSFWICRRPEDENAPLDYYTANVSKNSISIVDDSTKKALNGHFVKNGPNDYEFAIGSEKHLLKAPLKRLSGPSAVSSAAISPDGKTVLLGTLLGHISVYSTEIDELLYTINDAHYTDVTQLRFFPSNRAFLSVGADLSIKIWSSDAGESQTPARIFQNQTKLITDTFLIGSGRNFVSSSEDGSVNLWECGSGQLVHKFRRIDDHHDPVTCIAVGEVEADSETVQPERHFECAAKVLYVGYKSGLVQLYGVSTHHQMRQKLAGKAPVSAMVIWHGRLIVGYENGDVVIANIDDNLAVEKTLVFNRNYPIEHLAVVSGTRTIVFSNGPETVVGVSVSEGEDYHIEQTRQLVGFPETFRARAIGNSDSGLLVATTDGSALFGGF